VKIAYDTEFAEDGRVIGLLSIGMAAEDGRELYLVAGDPAAFGRAAAHPWLRANVLPHLPVTLLPGGGWEWDESHPHFAAVTPREEIAARVREFAACTPDPRLWADCGAYDHVALAQLFGDMAAWPPGLPFFTRELRQEADRLGHAELPAMPGAVGHSALWDAREVLWRLSWMRGHAAPHSAAVPRPDRVPRPGPSYGARTDPDDYYDRDLHLLTLRDDDDD
jgi:hypothetical protein